MSQQENHPTSDAVAILNRHLGDSPERRAEIDPMKQDLAIGSQIYQARKAAGMTQAELAERVGTTPSIICDLEDAEYQDYTLSILRRIAAALGLSVRVEFVGPSV